MRKINIKTYIQQYKKFPAVFSTEALDSIAIKIDKYTKPTSVIMRINDDTTDKPENFNDKLKLSLDVASQEDLENYIDSFNTHEVEELEKEKTRQKQGFQGIKGTGDGIRFDSKWEYGYYVYVRDILGQTIERNQSDFLYYIDAAGKRRKFYYDFLENGGTFTEVKGIWRANDILKMEQCPQVTFIYGEKMKQVLKILKKEKPDWESGFIAD